MRKSFLTTLNWIESSIWEVELDEEKTNYLDFKLVCLNQFKKKKKKKNEMEKKKEEKEVKRQNKFKWLIAFG